MRLRLEIGRRWWGGGVVNFRDGRDEEEDEDESDEYEYEVLDRERLDVSVVLLRVSDGASKMSEESCGAIFLCVVSGEGTWVATCSVMEDDVVEDVVLEFTAECGNPFVERNCDMTSSQTLPYFSC